MKKSKITIDDLAVMVKKGFDESKGEINGVKDEMRDEMDGMRGEMNARFDNLERGQEDIKLRLDNVAYRFELQEIERRVVLLEKKAKFV